MNFLGKLLSDSALFSLSNLEKIDFDFENVQSLTTLATCCHKLKFVKFKFQIRLNHYAKVLEQALKLMLRNCPNLEQIEMDVTLGLRTSKSNLTSKILDVFTDEVYPPCEMQV